MKLYRETNGGEREKKGWAGRRVRLTYNTYLIGKPANRKENLCASSRKAGIALFNTKERIIRENLR